MKRSGLKVGIINERGEGVPESEIRDIFLKTLKKKLKMLAAQRKFYKSKRPTIDEYMIAAEEIFNGTLGIAKRRAVVRRKAVEG